MGYSLYYDKLRGLQEDTSEWRLTATIFIVFLVNYIIFKKLIFSYLP